MSVNSSSGVLPAKISYMKKDRIDILCFDKISVTTIIKVSGKSKVHGQDGISVKVVKICTESLAQSLVFIFQNSLALGIFTYDWEKQTLLQFIKNQKQIVLHCRPVSALPVFSKTFEKKKQSLTEDIFLSFDSNLSFETGGVF